jgi:two-component system sensor histidine kinase/response regulator
VLLDSQMPDMDGFAVAARMMERPELRGATIMMLTSADQFGDSIRCRELGIREYLMKPIRQADLLEAICRCVEPRAPQSVESPRSEPAAAESRLRILLAEDNIVNQRVAVGLLTRRGHSVTVANNGLEALAALEHTAYDVVLMDIQMPEMGGVEATRAIREREAGSNRHTRIVAMTAHAMAGDRERYLADGMDDYVSKPIDPPTLFAAVEEPDAVRHPGPLHAKTREPLAIEELRDRLCGDDELMAEVTRMFLTDCPEQLAHIRAALAAGDRDLLRAGAHSLKGAASNLSAHPLAESAHALEQIAETETIDAASANLAWSRLELESARLIAALRSGITQPATVERTS